MTTELRRPVGRPRSFDADCAVAVAQCEFEARGYEAVGIADITEALGINPPSLYATFGSKAGLFERVIDRYAATRGSFVPKAFDGAASVADGLENLFDRAVTAYADAGANTGCLVLEGARNARDLRARAVCRRTRAAMRQTILDFVAIASPQDAERIADMAMIVLSGLSASTRDGIGQTTLRTFGALAAQALAVPQYPASRAPDALRAEGLRQPG